MVLTHMNKISVKEYKTEKPSNIWVIVYVLIKY